MECSLNMCKPTLEDKARQMMCQKQKEAETTLETVKCGKKVISVSKVKDTVVIMYSDCSYTTVDASLVDEKSFMGKGLEELTERVKALETKEDKDTIYDDFELRKSIKDLEDKVNAIPKHMATDEIVDGIGEHVTYSHNGEEM